SALMARRSDLFLRISFQALSSISYFSRIWSSEKIRSRLRAQSVMKAPPTSLFKGTETPRRGTIGLSDLGLSARGGMAEGGAVVGVWRGVWRRRSPGCIWRGLSWFLV